MWICDNEGFVSIVADRGNPDRLLVRARRKEDLEAVLKSVLPTVEIFSDKGADYKWRAFVDRKTVASIVANRILDIEYDNFKNSVKNDELHDLYAGFWEDHWKYQKNDPRNFGETRGKRH